MLGLVLCRCRRRWIAENTWIVAVIAENVDYVYSKIAFVGILQWIKANTNNFHTMTRYYRSTCGLSSHFQYDSVSLKNALQQSSCSIYVNPFDYITQALLLCHSHRLSLSLPVCLSFSHTRRIFTSIDIHFCIVAVLVSLQFSLFLSILHKKKIVLCALPNSTLSATCNSFIASRMNSNRTTY